MQRARDDNSQDRGLFQWFLALDYQIVLIFLIQIWALFMVSLRCSFDPLTEKVTVFLMSFPPLPQLLHSLRENTPVWYLIPTTCSSQCGFCIFEPSLCDVLKVLYCENMLNSDHVCHLSLHSCPLMAYLPARSSNLTSVVDQESKPVATCSLLHLSMPMLSLAALGTSGLWPGQQGRFMILWQMFLPHTCSRQGNTHSLLSNPAQVSVSVSFESRMNFLILL